MSVLKKRIEELKREYRRESLRQRRSEWKKGPAIERIENPSKPDRAREMGYKEKQGMVMARVRVRRGGRRKKRPVKGRRPKRMGVSKITPSKSIQLIAEERTARKFPNLEVLNSYKIGEDGEYHYYEIIMLDPNHPAIQNDPDFKWVTDSSHRGRVFRGLTREGKSSRGLEQRGEGSEKSRPSKRSGHH